MHPSPLPIPAAKKCLTMSSTLCGTHCQWAMASLAQTSTQGKCTCSSMCSWTHPNNSPSWCELIHHIFIPCLQHVLHLPEVIPEGQWVTCYNGKCLQDHFESLAAHEHTQSHWGSNKTINLTQRPKTKHSGPFDGSDQKP